MTSPYLTAPQTPWCVLCYSRPRLLHGLVSLCCSSLQPSLPPGHHHCLLRISDSCIGTIPPAHPDNSRPVFSLSGQDEHYLTDALFSLLECLLVGKERLAQETARQSHHPAPPIASETDIAREPLETWYRQLPLQGKYIAGEDAAEV